MLTDKTEFEKILSEKGIPDKILRGDNCNFAFLQWEYDNSLLNISVDLLNQFDNSLPVYAREMIEYKHCFYKLYIHSPITPKNHERKKNHNHSNGASNKAADQTTGTATS